MKKQYNHYFLISIIFVFLSFSLLSTVLVSSVGIPVDCIEVCNSGGGVSEESYCDAEGPCCCSPFSCIGHICTGCVEESGDCNVNSDCCSPATCIDYETDGKHCCPNDASYWKDGECSASADCAGDGIKYSATIDCCPDQGLTECSDGYCRKCCDGDKDGYGDPKSDDCSYSELDCDDDNKYVNPGASEICAGGHDEDCDGLTDCSDPDCSSSDFCISCSSNDDCPSSPCYTSACVGGSCSVSSFNCGSDDMCCFPYCSIDSDPDCEAGCGFVPLGQAVTYTFSPVPAGVGKLAGYGTSSSVKGVGSRGSTDYLGGSVTNKLSGLLQCNYPHVVRGYVIMDTSCISPDATIASVVFNYKIETVAGFNHKTIWLDTSDLSDSSNDWIINPSNVALSDAVMIADIFPVFTKHVLLNFAVNPNLIQRGRNTRFVFRWGDSSTSDFSIANTLSNCPGSTLSCGTKGRCDCRYNGNLAGGGVRPTPCGSADPCYDKDNLRDTCYMRPPYNNCIGPPPVGEDWKGVDSKTNAYSCKKFNYFKGDVTGVNPSLDITFCNPGGLNFCDNSDGCGGIIDTGVYNSCDLNSSDVCGAETNCTDGIDEDCDGLIECVDETDACAPGSPG